MNYGYDVAGNMVDLDGTSRTFNAANQMTNDGTNTLTYDDNGNLTAVGSDTYTWDRANRLLSVGNHSYVYDGLGNRVQQTVSSVVTDYLNDVQPGLVKLLRQDDGSNVDHFVHAPRGIHAVDDGTAWNFYVNDGLGSVRALLDDAGVVQSSLSYDPYGMPLGSTPDNFGFTGEQTDTNGQVFLRARYYEPQLGIFSALDPWEGISNRPMSLNGYSWVEGSVINATDPSGMCIFAGVDTALCIAGAALLLAGGALAFSASTQPSRNMSFSNPNMSLPDVPLPNVRQNITDGISNISDFALYTCVPAFLAISTAIKTSITCFGGGCAPPVAPPRITETVVPTVVLPPATIAPLPTVPPVPVPTVAPTYAPHPTNNPNATPTAQPTLLPPPVNPQPTVTTTETPEQERPIVLDIGAGVNFQEVDNILMLRPNNKVVVVDFDTTIIEIMLRPRYGSDRLETINGNFALPNILNGRKAIEMFSIYPDSSATNNIYNAVNNHLETDGFFYTVTERNSWLVQMENSLSPIMGFAYVNDGGVPVSHIQSGNNGPAIPFNSDFSSGVSTVYDLWGYKL